MQAEIAESRIAIEQARLLTMKAAWLMDTVGNKGAASRSRRSRCSRRGSRPTVIDRAIQLFGGAGVSHDWPLAEMYTHARTLHLVDGPDEVHKQQIAGASSQYELPRVTSYVPARDCDARCATDGVEGVKVRIGYGLGAQGLGDGGARFAELVDALEAQRLRLAVAARSAPPARSPTRWCGSRSRPAARRS